MTLELTDVAELLPGIDVKNLPTIVPLSTLIDLHKALSLREMERDTARNEAETLTEKLLAANQTNEALAQEKGALEKQVQDLTRALADAAKPPVVVPPTPPIPPTPSLLIISKTEISGLFALTIENGDKGPSDLRYETVRSVLTKAKGMGFNAWRAFLNLDEVRSHLRRTTTDPNHLPAFGRMRGLEFIADTVGTALRKLDAAGSREYLKGLEALGATAVVFNDANNEEPLDLVAWTQRVREVLPNTPIIASLTGTAKISEYPMFDLYEAQTFGSQSELAMFITRAFNIFCLDARPSISAEGMRVRGQVLIAARPKPIKAIFYYTDLAIDWLSMPPDKVETIKGILAQLKTR